jgi:hypothetical protein
MLGPAAIRRAARVCQAAARSEETAWTTTMTAHGRVSHDLTDGWAILLALLVALTVAMIIAALGVSAWASWPALDITNLGAMIDPGGGLLEPRPGTGA